MRFHTHIHGLTDSKKKEEEEEEEEEEEKKKEMRLQMRSEMA